ncbi:septal ring lytic transglycosylase RlpA family protein [Aquabacterium sp. A08]|uniref:septal ring lytic transglycosylase RlpA family protein n=1 Tax=Aquabacterium sp. A08 TaxID=2718532 RepID=UPI001FB91DD4|nr:septal ring lytic transglycosylase RlpA family protein [Aquabacterium sp. A08]
MQQGLASFYHQRFHGRRTASGERYNRHALTAAHPTLPFGTEIVVRSLRTGREVVVRVTDRGPHLARRIVDLSHAAAVALGIQRHGVSEVQLWALPAHPP